MNKKFMLFAALILLATFLTFIIIIILRKVSPSPQQSVVESGQQLPAGGAGTVTPATQNDFSGQGAVKSPVGDSQDSSLIVDNFKWTRMLYYNDNEDSKKLLAYLTVNKIGQKLVLGMRDLKNNSAFLQELSTLAKQCRLTGDPLTVVPLVYDRVTKQCYYGYYYVVSYLDEELAADNK